MAAIVSIQQCTGATPTVTPITNLRFNTDDTANPASNNPLVRPAAGTNRSYTKTIYLNADTSPSGTINNVKIYCDGAIGWTGCTLYIGSSATYTQATGTVGSSGADSLVAITDMATFTVGSPKAITGTISNPTIGKITDYIMMQVDVASTSVAGTLVAETLTVQYDEN